MANNRGSFFTGDSEGSPSGARLGSGTPTGGGVPANHGNFFTGATGSAPGDSGTIPGTPTGGRTEADTYVVSGVFNREDQNFVLTRNDSQTITVNLANLFSYIDTKNLTGANWVESTETLTINQGARSISQRITGFEKAGAVVNTDDYVINGSYNASNERITLTRKDGATIDIDLSALIALIPTDTRLVTVAFSDSDTITFTDNNDSEISLDVSSLNNEHTTVEDVFGVTNVSTGEILKKTATGWEAATEAAAPTFNDTSNTGTTLGVNFTNTNGVITATVDAAGLPDSDTTYTAGTGIQITNNVISSTVVNTDTTYSFASGTGGTFTVTSSGSTTTISTGADANPSQYIKEITVNSNGTITITDQNDSDVTFTPNVGLTSVTTTGNTLAGAGTTASPLKVDSDSIGYEEFDESATFSEDHAGLVPHAAGSDNKFINENAQWVSVTRPYFASGSVFTTDETGTVPAPTASEVEDGKVLRADGTWVGGAAGGGGLQMQDQYSNDSEVDVMRLQINSDTGLELFQLGEDSTYWQLRVYVPPPPASLSLSGVPSNYSWFTTATSVTVQASATGGVINEITSASISNSGPEVTIDNTDFDMTFNRPTAHGSYTLSVAASVTRSSDSEVASYDASGSWSVYRDFFFATNQASDSVTAPFTGSGTRRMESLSNGDTITCVGHSYLDVPDNVTFRLTDAFGELPVNQITPVAVSYTLNGVTKSYDRYYLGEYLENTYTVSGVSG